MKINRLFLLLAAAALLSMVFLSGCGQKEAGRKTGDFQKLKVAMVIIGNLGDKSFNDMAYEGIEQAGQEFGEKFDFELYNYTTDDENYEDFLRSVAQKEYDLIIAAGNMFIEEQVRTAADYPRTKFAALDSAVPGLTEESNITCLTFKENEGSFLMGAAAALKSKNGKVGFIGGMQLPVIDKFKAGYIAGAKYIDPEIEVFENYIEDNSSGFSNPDKGKEIATQQIKAGADVIFQAAGGSGAGIIEAASQQKIFVIGSDSDQTLIVPEDHKPFVLTSMIKRCDLAVYETIKSLVNQELKGGCREFDLRMSGVGYAENDYNKSLIAEIKPRLEEIKAKIISGEIKVPTN
jgi:basic membrane protein A